MFNKELEKRILSLEEYLGLVYVNADYPEHVAREGKYTLINKIKKLTKED